MLLQIHYQTSGTDQKEKHGCSIIFKEEEIKCRCAVIVIFGESQPGCRKGEEGEKNVLTDKKMLSPW